MIITIYQGPAWSNSSVLLGSKDKRFHEAYGQQVRVAESGIYAVLADISSWVNNTLNEECLFEVD